MMFLSWCCCCSMFGYFVLCLWVVVDLMLFGWCMHVDLFMSCCCVLLVIMSVVLLAIRDLILMLWCDALGVLLCCCLFAVSVLLVWLWLWYWLWSLFFILNWFVCVVGHIWLCCVCVVVLCWVSILAGVLFLCMLYFGFVIWCWIGCEMC